MAYERVKPTYSNIYILTGDTPGNLHDTFNWAIILQYFSILNYELFCKRNGIPLGAHFTRFVRKVKNVCAYNPRS